MNKQNEIKGIIVVGKIKQKQNKKISWTSAYQVFAFVTLSKLFQILNWIYFEIL